MDDNQHNENVRAGSEPFDSKSSEKPNSELVQSGMGYNGELQLAGQITLRGTGANTIELRKVGVAGEKVVNPSELAGLIQDKYFPE